MDSPVNPNPQPPLETLQKTSQEVSQEKPSDVRTRLQFTAAIAITLAASTVLVKAALDPNLGKTTPYLPPETLAIENWEQIGSRPLSDPESNRLASRVRTNTGRGYEFKVDNLPIAIEVRYLVRTTGDVPALLEDFARLKGLEKEILRGIQPAPKPQDGYYTIFQANQRAYLGACINPRGYSTVTKEQFEENMSIQARNPVVFLNWLGGQADFRDRRCLLTLISIETDTANFTKNKQELDRIWQKWYTFWDKRFPKL